MAKKEARKKQKVPKHPKYSRKKKYQQDSNTIENVS